MGVIITPQEEIEAYYNDDSRMSQSLLKKLIGGVDSFLKYKEDGIEEKEHLIFGKAVDTILTGEPGEFEKEYYISELENKPSDVERGMIEHVLYELKNAMGEDSPLPKLTACASYLEDAAVEFNWYGGKPGAKRISGLIERGTEYFEDIKNAYGKTVLSSFQKQTIDSIVMSLQTHERTKGYFDKEIYARDNKVDIYYQLPIYFTYMGIECKALLDIVIVEKDDEGKIENILPVDLKTMAGNTINFMDNFKRLRYDIQAGFYTMALHLHFGFDITIYQFQFVVESYTLPGKPLVYQITDEILAISRYGRKALMIDNVIIRNEIKGFDDLLREYLWYEEKGWNEERVIAESDGVLEIDWNGIIQ